MDVPSSSSNFIKNLNFCKSFTKIIQNYSKSLFGNLVFIFKFLIYFDFWVTLLDFHPKL